MFYSWRDSLCFATTATLLSFNIPGVTKETAASKAKGLFCSISGSKIKSSTSEYKQIVFLFASIALTLPLVISEKLAYTSLIVALEASSSLVNLTTAHAKCFPTLVRSSIFSIQCFRSFSMALFLEVTVASSSDLINS